MDPLWLKEYPAGVPHDIKPEEYSSVVELLEDSLKKYADQPISVCMDVWMKYGELDKLSQQLGAWLQSLQLEPDARVAIMLPNIPQFAVSMAGVLRAGYTCVNVNPLYTARELEHQLKDFWRHGHHHLGKLRAHLGGRDWAHAYPACVHDRHGRPAGRSVRRMDHVCRTAPRQNGAQVRDCAGWPQRHALQESTVHRCRQAAAQALRQPRQHRLFAIHRGTTGLSKGAVLTHRNIIAATLQAEAWFAPAYQGRTNLSKLHSIAALPLYHIFALTLLLLALRQGSSLSLIPNPRDIPKFVEVLRKRPFHTLPAVNTLFNALLQNEKFRAIDFSELAVSQSGGAWPPRKAPPSNGKKLTGKVMIEGWGMSETCAIGTNNAVTATHFSGTIGLPCRALISLSKMMMATTSHKGKTAKSASKARTSCAAITTSPKKPPKPSPPMALCAPVISA